MQVSTMTYGEFDAVDIYGYDPDDVMTLFGGLTAYQQADLADDIARSLGLVLITEEMLEDSFEEDATKEA